MKIKEAIEKTGLTDKAIRLYIDNELVAPSIDESYSGRKSIDFSSDDVERLKNVALLRKAGFSIQEIRDILESEEKAFLTVKNFIDKTEKNIAHDKEIIFKLKNIESCQFVTIETICDTLSETDIKSEVPAEDLKLTFVERAKKNFAIIFSSIIMALCIIWLITTLLYYKLEYVHLKPENDIFPMVIFTYGGTVLIFTLSLIMLIINYSYIPTGKKSKKIEIATGVISLLIISFGILSFFASFFGTFFVSALFYSQTTDPADYLILDSFVEYEAGEELEKLFPGKIPTSASVIEEREYDECYPFTTKYYYKYSNSIDTYFDIVAEWKLTDKEFKKAVNDVEGKEISSEEKGDWTCLIIKNEIFSMDDEDNNIWNRTWYNDTYNISFFAYNSKTKTVRYITAHAMDGYPYGPYFLSLDW